MPVAQLVQVHKVLGVQLAHLAVAQRVERRLNHVHRRLACGLGDVRDRDNLLVRLGLGLGQHIVQVSLQLGELRVGIRSHLRVGQPQRSVDLLGHLRRRCALDDTGNTGQQVVDLLVGNNRVTHTEHTREELPHAGAQLGPHVFVQALFRRQHVSQHFFRRQCAAVPALSLGAVCHLEVSHLGLDTLTHLGVGPHAVGCRAEVIAQ